MDTRVRGVNLVAVVLFVRTYAVAETVARLVNVRALAHGDLTIHLPW
jgi:hypothetical protein